jgi:hypothetical protein
MARSWRVVANFHSVGEVVVFVQAPNWQGGLRKGALAVKREPRLKGRRITVGAFTIQEIDSIPVAQAYEQLPMASVERQPVGEVDNPPVVPVVPEELE